MTVFQLLLKLAADLRAKNGEALATVLQLFALIFGFNPITVTPNPTPPVGGVGTLNAADCDVLAAQIEAFVAEHDKPGAAKIGDGVFLGKLLDLLIKILPILIGQPVPAA